MFNKILSAAALVLALVLCGCGKDTSATETTSAVTTVGDTGPKAAASKLLGQWDVVMANGTSAVATFEPNGNYVFEAQNPNAKTMIIKMMGKYREDGDTLFLTWTDAAFENTPDEAKAMEAQMLADLKKTLNVGKEVQTTMTWEDQGVLKTTSPEGKITTFKKK